MRSIMGTMRSRADGAIVVALLLLVSCAGAGADAGDRSSSPATETADPTPTSSTPFAAPQSDLDAAVPTSKPPAADSTTDAASVSVVPETAAPSSVSPDPVEPDDSSAESAGDTEDPSFELGPEVVLDVDVARFPPDDAGVGGGSVSTIAATPGSPDGTAAVAGWAGVDQYLESVLVRAGNTAASVAVSIDGEVVHRAAFGVRDPATGEPAEVQDRFRIASISKLITAITILALVEDGVIGLDEPIGDVVARHVGLNSATGAASGLTFRQLITHRSGFGKFDSTFFRGGATDCIDAARSGLSSGSGGGGGYVYSNMNFCIAGLAIEAVTGLGYEQAVYRQVLTPLGITGMRLAPTFDPGPDEIQHVTTPGRNYMETLGAAGGWIATPSDLVTILDSLDVNSGGFKPLEIETVLQMLTPPGAQLGQRGYAQGIIAYGANRVGHTGTIESTHAMLLNRGDGVIWAITVAGQFPGESTSLERIMNDAFAAGGFVAG